MKITKVRLKNIIGIEQLDREVKGSLLLEGTNGSGKSSVIDAIRVAINNKTGREVIIKKGHNEGEIYIELDDITVERKKRNDKSDYKKVTKGGQEIASPETFLKSLFSELQLNPAEFMNLTDKEKNRVILNMIEFTWDLKWIEKKFGEVVKGVDYDQHILEVLNEIQSDKGYYYQTRQDVNRQVRDKSAVIKEIMDELPENYSNEKWENFSLMDIYDKINKMKNDNEYKERLLSELKDIEIKKANREKEVADEITKIYKQKRAKEKELNKKIEALKEELNNTQQRLNSLEDKSTTIVTNKQHDLHKEIKDKDNRYKEMEQQYIKTKHHKKEVIDEKQEEAQYAENMKSYLKDYSRVERMQDEIEILNADSELLTKQIELARILPGEILKTATIPIKQLTVENGRPLINGLPVNNLSEGELLDLCVDVAIQKPEGLRLVLLDSIPNDLSPDNQERLFKKLKDHDIQFIATKTTNDKELKIIEL